ncbi:DUF3806 domain-containing protein [Cellulomonas sp. H30R-01]|uniref:DUF3806 domain-containing protein n=1 Tax=Cellulomonas sp. H30R-01 TaxID=2704467 RepID=UPI00138B8998|nr:DUF3806 domain-containing protein [Cellulomonas sp. H30R-01]QHT57962.1 DUF3806 domain-containing protein [Cellulomonas sp. H30R-01]
MSEDRTSPAQAATMPGLRPLTVGEQGHLDSLRAHVRRSRTDVTDVADVARLVHETFTGWAGDAGAAVPEGVVAALGVVVGDLVVARAPGAHWVLRTAGPTPTPCVVSPDGEAAVLPLDDIRARWDIGVTPDWASGYVAAAAAHLAVSGLPTEDADRTPAFEVPQQRTPAPAGSLPRRTAAPAPDDTPAPSTGYRTPGDLPEPPSPATQDLGLRALEHALDAVLGGECPLVTFAMTHDGVHRVVQTFPGDSRESADRARAWVRASGAAAAVVAWEGELPGDEPGTHAVVVEASGPGRPSMVVGHRYAPAKTSGEGRARAPRPVGEPMIVGQGDPLL